VRLDVTSTTHKSGAVGQAESEGAVRVRELADFGEELSAQQCP
jgi:hypothetical protein